MTDRPKIVVVGSINMDLVATGKRLPAPGETVMADGLDEVPGGKGANQAVAASRAGGQVTMIGRVGDDAFAEQLIQNLRDEGVDCQAVSRTPQTPSGVALITVDDAGENQIVVVPGANGKVGPDDVRRHAQLIEQADALLVQLEVPVATVICAIEIARQSQTCVILDPAPPPDRDPPRALFGVDLICPNETEAMALTGLRAGSAADIRAIGHDLQGRGARAVAVTLGARGVALFDGTVMVDVPAKSTSAMDATAAGDAFAGAVAVRWVETGDLQEAVLWGNAAGALASARAGAQPSLPTRAEIDRLVSSSS